MTNKVLLQEVAYQLDKGLSVVLHKKKQAPWPTFPLRIRLYEIMSHKVENIEIQELKCLHFAIKDFHGYDPKIVCKKHYERISFNWVCSSISTAEDENVENWYNTFRKTHLGFEAISPQVPPSQDMKL